MCSFVRKQDARLSLDSRASCLSMLLDAAEADAGIGQRETGLHAYAGAETDADTANLGGGDVIGQVCPLAADGRVERAEVTETHRFAVNDGAENVFLHGRKHSLHIVYRNRTLPADGIGQSFRRTGVTGAS